MKAIDKLILQEIKASYRSEEEILPVLDGVSLRVKEGEFVSVLGPSGSGKSTILKIAAGLLKPDRGKVFVDGSALDGKPRLTGYMPQRDLLFPWKTLEQNAALPLVAAGMSGKEARARVERLLPSFGLTGFAGYYPYQLSGGMRQRAALLRTIMVDSGLLLLDEPFASLDALTREAMQQFLLGVWERFRKTALLVTHSVDEAIYLSDRVYIITERPGRIACEQRIDLPRPRSGALTTSADFSACRSLLGQALSRDRDSGGAPAPPGAGPPAAVSGPRVST